MKRILVSAAALFVVSLMGAAPTWAEMRKSALEVGGFIYHSSFDNDSNIEDNEGFGGRLGILFTENHELEFSFEHVGTEDEFFGLDVDLDTFKAGYVYNILPDSPVSPFVTVGGGFQQVSIDAFDEEETDPMGYGGGGVRFFIGNMFHIRVDGLIEGVSPDQGDNLYDVLLQAGVGWIIGGH